MRRARQENRPKILGKPPTAQTWPAVGNPFVPPVPVVDNLVVSTFEIRPLDATDAAPIARAFAAVGWPGKAIEQYQRYVDEQAANTRAVFVASVRGDFAGYVTVSWTSGYVPFREAGIPEIQDLNVLPQFRRRGIAAALMDSAEALVATQTDIVGIGVGLYADYAAAHLMYLCRGYRPDGRGLAYRGVTIKPGTSVRVDDDLALMMTRTLR
jgi:GNAT superfamily N-acetyltransferase